jgi:hypothetical protein
MNLPKKEFAGICCSNTFALLPMAGSSLKPG